MNDRITPEGSPAATVTRPRRRLAQFGLLTLLLVMAVIAGWTAYFTNRRHVANLEARIRAMRPMARELIVDDPDRIAIVKHDELWYDENIWGLYLPPGRYRLCLATRDVAEQGMGPVVTSAVLTGGRHELALEQRKEETSWRVTVTAGTQKLLEVEEPDSWNSGTGSVGGGQFSDCTQLPADQAVVLFRRRFTRRDKKGVSTTPQGPTEGVMLWLERDASSEAP